MAETATVIMGPENCIIFTQIGRRLFPLMEGMLHLRQSWRSLYLSLPGRRDQSRDHDLAADLLGITGVRGFGVDNPAGGTESEIFLQLTPGASFNAIVVTARATIQRYLAVKPVLDFSSFKDSTTATR